MKISLAFSSLMLVSSAQAHCYSKWYYPYPQHCGMAVAKLEEKDDHSWYVEITEIPPAWLDERAQAVEKLKEQLK